MKVAFGSPSARPAELEQNFRLAGREIEAEPPIGVGHHSESKGLLRGRDGLLRWALEVNEVVVDVARLRRRG
eukprot:3966626-Lingulodinium_polyedra.AAC.1